jgi:hypothetical protein
VAEKRPEIHSSGRYIDIKEGEVSKSLFLGYNDPVDRSSKFVRNVGSHLPIQTASYPTRLESPTTTLPEPHMSQRQNVLLSIAQPLSLSIPRSLLGFIRNHTIKETTQYLMCGDSDHIHHLQHKSNHARNVPSAVMWREWKAAAPQSRLPLNKYVSALGCML